MRRTRPLTERFWSKVLRTAGCWEWQGGHYTSGYGTFSLGARNPAYAHRVSWELHNGPIPAGLHVLHRCDNRNCVNPDHLFLGTNLDNTNDKTLKGRAAKKLSDHDVRVMRFVRQLTNVSYLKLGGAFGVSEKQAMNIVRREQWGHV